MEKPFLPYDRDDSPEPETPIDVDKNPLPQDTRIQRQPDETEVEVPTDPEEPVVSNAKTKKKRSSKKTDTRFL